MAQYLRLFETNEEFESIYNKPEEGYVEPWVSLTDSNGEVNYNYNEWEEWYKQKKNPFTLEITSGGTLMMYGLCYPGEDLRYRINGGEWVVLVSDHQWLGVENPTVQSGDVIEFVGINPNFATCDEDSRGFFATGWGWNDEVPSWVGEEEGFAKFKARGNILSMVDKNNYQTMDSLPEGMEVGLWLFEWCSALVDAGDLVLPILDLTTPEGQYYGNITYDSLFWACKNMVRAPKLPSTTLGANCYRKMFGGCQSMTVAPVLPATAVPDSAYEQMFSGCISLTQAPELPGTELGNYCYSSMFRGCTGLTAAPALPATVLAPGCYAYMFFDCTSLTAGPELPATALASHCYYCMFHSCTGLTAAPALPATALTESCYESMFYSCTGLTTAPELPAPTLVSSCYEFMFGYCTSLTYVKCLATDISANRATRYWFEYGVPNTSSCTFVKAASMTSWPRTVSGIPSNWTVQDA